VRPLGLVVLAMTCLAAADAAADVKTLVRIEKYRVSGGSGEALMAAMDRNGPSHGFAARAIAQTRYSVAWEMGWKVEDGQCRLDAADVTLSVNYRYPELVGKASPALRKRWARFLAGVRRHEETHGRLARQMTVKARRAALRVVADDDWFCIRCCWSAKREVARVVRDVYADYEARQERFDVLEHQPGGPVDRMVGALIGRRR
jgi:predicted secreted Zn-dependent protease